MIRGIIETNILVGANGGADHLSIDDQEKCISFIKLYKEESLTYIDSLGLVFKEYQKYCSFSGKPNVGDYFFKWLWDNQANDKICKSVEINPIDEDGCNFRELSALPKLDKFDKSDKKFVAISVSSNKEPTIFNACDSDWNQFSLAFKEYGIKVEKII